MINTHDILETINMIDNENLDVRTVTMGISLLGCIRDSAEATAQKVYDLICQKAEHIVKTANDLSGEYGIPIVNKRVSITPAAVVGSACCRTSRDFVAKSKCLRKFCS